MCGISAIVSFAGNDSNLADLRTMHGLLAQRGPDGEGALFIDQSLRAEARDDVSQHGAEAPAAMFAFRRLRIQDLSPTADQPFARAGRPIWIVFNGEIYNHHDLRAEIGGEFKTHSDTEVALAAYQRWGTDCFTRFEGMWAMLIVDLERRTLVGSRDRLGIKPLCYSFEADRLLIASEPKAIAAVREGGARIHGERLRQFLNGFPQQSPLVTFFEDVHYVPPATTFEVPLGRRFAELPFRRFWDLRPFTSSEAALRNGSGPAIFDQVLTDAVRSHLVADVPVGALMSGGLDSSTITRLMATERRKHGAPPPKTFSITYSDPAMDESPWIDSMIRQGDLDATCEQLDQQRVFELIDAVVEAQGEPLLGQELIAQYSAFRLARQRGVIVVLDGQGADEILGGYPFYEGFLVRDLVRKMRVFAAATEVRALARKYGRTPLRVMLGHLAAPMRRRLPSYSWLSESPRATARPDDGLSSDALNRILYLQTTQTNLPAVLQYEDRNSMAHSVEARVPFLDHRLVEIAFRLPQEWKIHHGDRKRILRRFARTILPADVVERRDKKAFVSSPNWFDLNEQPEALAALEQGLEAFDVIGVHRERLRQFVRDYVSRRHNDRLAVWRVYTTWRWLERFRPSASRGDS